MSYLYKMVDILRINTLCDIIFVNLTIVGRLYALHVFPHSSVWICGFLRLYPHNKTVFVMGTIKPILKPVSVTIYKDVKPNGLCI
jgi:hypothetical protein